MQPSPYHARRAAVGVRLAFRLAARNLRGGFGRFTIFIACLALGIATISAVDTVSRGIESALREDGRAILGGDFTLRSVYLQAMPEQLAALKNLGDVSETIQMRANAIEGDRSILVELKAVDTLYPLYGALTLEDGGDIHKALGGTGAVVARDVLDRLDLKPGDSFTMGQGRFTIAGVIEREPDAASASGIVLGPRVLVTKEALAASGLLQPGTLFYWNYAIRLHPDVAFEKARIAVEENATKFGWEAHSYIHASPTIQNVLDSLLQFLTLVGVSALIVGGIGIGNAVTAALEARYHTIATMKCLGASRRLVFWIFLIETLAVALIAIVIGIIVGVGVPVVLGPWLARILPIAPRLTVEAGTIASSFGYGMLITLMFALPALFHSGQVSPVLLFRSRLAMPPLYLGYRQMFTVALVLALFCLLLFGRSHDPHLAGVFLFMLTAMICAFAWAGQMVVTVARRLQPYAPPAAEVRLALANLHRPGNRTRDMMISLGMGLAVLIAIGLVETNFRQELASRVNGEAPTFFFLDIQRNQFAQFKQVLTGIDATSDFESTPSMRGRIAAVNGIQADKALKDTAFRWVLGSDRGITYATDLPKGSRLTEGTWWKADDKPGEPQLSITTGIAHAFGIHPGDHMTLNITGRNVTARVANVREVNWGTFNINFTLVFAPGTLEAAPQTWLATIRATPGAKRQIETIIARQFPNISAIDVTQIMLTINKIMDQIATAISLAAGIILATGVLVLLGAVFAGFERRTGDAVIMKVLGATRPRLFRIFLIEYGVLGLCAAFIAFVSGTAASLLVTRGIFHFEWNFYLRPAVLTLLLGLGLTLAIGFGVTIVVLGRKAGPYLRNE